VSTQNREASKAGRKPGCRGVSRGSRPGRQTRQRLRGRSRPPALLGTRSLRFGRAFDAILLLSPSGEQTHHLIDAAAVAAAEADPR